MMKLSKRYIAAFVIVFIIILIATSYVFGWQLGLAFTVIIFIACAGLIAEIMKENNPSQQLR